MSFITGLILIDAPASALNNAPQEEGARTGNVVPVKQIKTRIGSFPYVSAQAFRYWLRTTLENNPELGWKSSPVFREQKIAYPDANPIEYWDDDLFGYMRAPSKKTEAVEARKADKNRSSETQTTTEITRVSPFRVSTFVSIAPGSIVDDFGTMSRHNGDPVPHEHEFYRAILKGIFSLDLKSAGTFSYRDKSGFKNLDDVRKNLAQEKGLELLEHEMSYRLPLKERRKRIRALLTGISTIYGGAKQALHYTDVTPSVLIAMITKGGNNPLQYIVGADSRGLLSINTNSVEEMVKVWGDKIASRLYIGWVQGFYDEEREKLRKKLEEISINYPVFKYFMDHPRNSISELITDLEKEENKSWLE